MSSGYSFKNEPDPNDPNDPRVVTEWIDPLGQVVRPGDWIAFRGYHDLGYGKVLVMNKLRKSGKPMQGTNFTITVHCVEYDPQPTNPRTGQPLTNWAYSNRQFFQGPFRYAMSNYERPKYKRGLDGLMDYDNPEMTLTPVTQKVRHPNLDAIKIAGPPPGIVEENDE